ncbi:MAG: M16 family metallopeptidase [Thermodesulfobacteriota bacterium]
MTHLKTRFTIKALITIILSLLLMPAVNSFAELKTVREVLPNGMVVLVQEAHSAPVAALQIWVRTGSADEDPERGGISHVFEHMLFKGTARRQVGEMASLVESLGGNINAYTSFDNTVYHLVVPSEHFSTGLDLLGDAVQNSAFDPGELDKELKVVLEEIRMNEDSPMRTLYKNIFADAYKVHPYGRPVIGKSEVVAKFTRDYIVDVFKTYYRPENMTLVVAGDVSADEVVKEASMIFKGFKRGTLKRRKRPAEPAQRGVRASVTTQDINETYLGMAFHIPEMKNKDTYAIDVASNILSGGVSSRLYKALKIKTHLVHSISAYSMSLKDPGLFFITAGLDSKNVTEATKRIIEVISKLGIEGPDSDELQRAKVSISANFIYSRQTMQGRAQDLGYNETIAGDYTFSEKYLSAIKAITKADVKEVMQKYFTEDNISVAAVTPEKEDERLTKEAVTEFVQEAYQETSRLTKKIQKAPEVKKVLLENGITLIVKNIPANPSVSFYATFPGGLIAEDSENNGIGSFTASMLTRGTTTYSREELAKEVEGLAGSIGGFSARNSSGATATFLSSDFDKGLSLFADVLLNPTFPDVEIKRLRKDVLAAIKKQEDNIPSYTFKLFLKSLYKDHPYGMPVIGRNESIQKLKRADLENHYKKLFVPKRMILVIAGDVDVEYGIARARKVFGGFKRTSPGIKAPVKPEKPTDIRRTGAVRDKAQTNVGLGFMATTIGSPDSYPLAVVSEILSGQGGRLFINLRDKKALAYSVSAFLRGGIDPGFFALYIASAPEKKEEALQGLLNELKIIQSELVTKKELTRARNYITGSYEIGLQTPSSQAANLANNELFGLGYDFSKKYIKLIQAVTREDVLRVAKKYLDLNAYTISVVGPEKTDKTVKKKK